jgi:hypothetical protein
MPRGKRQPITIGNRNFDTLKDATQFISWMLDNLPRNKPLLEPHDSFLRDLCSMHPRADEKMKGEISYFSIGPDSYNGRCFYLHRPDGTKTDFGSGKCLRGEKRDTLVLGALRTAVMDQTEQFRRELLGSGTEIVCPFEGIVLDFGNSHVDHQSPKTFYTLVQQWLSVTKLTLAEVAISESADNKTCREMTDPEQRESWCNFHRTNASLRLTSVRGNLSGAKLEKNTPG